jgi:DNA polymerase (family X)
MPADASPPAQHRPGGPPAGAPPAATHPTEVARALREIGLLLEVEGGNRFRARAYARAARAVEALGDSLETLVAEGGLTRVPGIGSTLAGTIDELVRTGRCAQLERLRRELPPEARDARTQRRIRTALAQRADGPSEAALLHDATRDAEDIVQHLRTSPAVERVDVAGALRRRTETATRIELVASGADAASILDAVSRLPQAASVLERGTDHIALRLTSGLTLRVLVVPTAAYVAAWHRLTGSDAHLARLEARARERHITMDARGLRRRGRALAVRDEGDIYRHLGLAPIVPELREDAGEIEAAAAGTLPRELVSAQDIRGLVHCHTTYSDGMHSIEEMARAADALGMQYLTITDHSPTATYAGGLTVERLRRQWDEIARVQDNVRVRLLRGTESDILADGSLDYPDRILAELDVVIASVHHRHRMDAAQMTRRIIAAMRHPQFKIWGHALGRYILRRPPFACHMDEILDALAGARAAIEVNGDPHRLDMEPRWLREARRRGIPFVISTDAHSVAAFSYLRWGVDMARRGWVTRGEVLNALEVEAFRAAVRP